MTGVDAPAKVRHATDRDGNAWMHYVESHRDVNLGHHWGWRYIVCEVHDLRAHYLIAERGHEIVGVLPMAEVKSVLFGHSLVSLPFVANAGPLYNDERVRHALLDEATRIADRLNVGHLELRNTVNLHAGWAQQDLYVVFRRDLSPDHDENMQRIPRKQRAMVRKGIAHQLASTETDAKTMHALYSDNVHRHGTPGHSIRYFEAIQHVFGDDCSFLLINGPNGKALSSVMSMYWLDTVHPTHAGDVIDARKYSANDFKYWELMRRAVDRGTRIFDYGRSKRGTGPFDFKTNWGFEPTPLYYEYLLRNVDAVPENNPLNPRFRLMIEAWRRMPRWFVNAAGPRIIRTLG